MFRKGFRLLLIWGLFLTITSPAWGVRVKDIANLRGARDNQLIGFGLVVGLDGTGDSPGSLLSRKPIVNALERVGISLASEDISGQSIAAVWLTALISILFAASTLKAAHWKTTEAHGTPHTVDGKKKSPLIGPFKRDI